VGFGGLDGGGADKGLWTAAVLIEHKSINITVFKHGFDEFPEIGNVLNPSLPSI
jgi:hypothetical protein